MRIEPSLFLRSVRFGLWAALLLAAPVRGQAPAPTPAPASAPKAAAAADDNFYIGSESCEFCHMDLYKRYQQNPHVALESDTKLGPDGGWMGKSCESCHGMGGNHSTSGEVASIRNPAKLAAQAASQVCLSCHRNQPTQTGRLQDSHARNQIACTGCHTVHGSHDQLLLSNRKTVNEQCSTCHPAVRAEFSRPYTHRLEQGAMSCVDCHDPHNRSLSATVRIAAAANQNRCVNCHGDKRGPFLFEHAPMRTEGCMGCHQPHGSANPRMLTRNEQSVVCLQCHANLGQPNTIGGVPPAFHDLRSSRFENCAVCHIKVHGSNVNRELLR